MTCCACCCFGNDCLSGCRTKEEQQPEVIVYTALDREFSEPIFEEFTKKTGIAVRAKYDAESTKTVGLTEAIMSERARPRCDLFWNNEVINTIRLERAGLLRPYKSPAAATYPASSHSPDGMWYGFAARARVLIVNTNQLPEGASRNRSAISPIRNGTIAAASPSRCSARRPRKRPACSQPGATTRRRIFIAT